MNQATALICAAAGVALMAACGDDSPGEIDAGDAAMTCDCPAAEPPLTGRIMHVRADNVLPANSGGLAAAFCPTGAIALGGACEVQILDDNVVLMSTRFTLGDAPGYRCDWTTAGTTIARTGTAEVVCLLPAP